MVIRKGESEAVPSLAGMCGRVSTTSHWGLHCCLPNLRCKPEPSTLVQHSCAAQPTVFLCSCYPLTCTASLALNCIALTDLLCASLTCAASPAGLSCIASLSCAASLTCTGSLSRAARPA